MRFFLILIIAIFLGGFYSAGYAKNVIYIVVEGVSRDTLYPLIKKNQLPNYNQIIERGNYRNLKTSLNTQYGSDRE